MTVHSSQPPRPSWPYVTAAITALALGLMARPLRPPEPAKRVAPPDRSGAAWASPASRPEGPTPASAPRQLPGALPAGILQALREADEARRTAQLQGALRDWAAIELEAAAEWALAQTALHHDLALTAVIQGGATDPDRLTGLVGQLSVRFPARAPDYGSYLIAALSQVHAHEKAAAFAATADASVAVDWLVAAYTAWGRREPDRALDHLAHLTDEARQSIAFRATVSGWARSDPAGLVAVAARMSGSEQRFALLTGVHAWIEQDPAAAADWIAKAPSQIEWERIVDN